MIQEFKVDLHVHTTLSPCGDINMIPSSIVEHAIRKNLDIIGICDHNSSENFLSVKEAASEKRLHVFGGMEITSREEAHILAVFDDSAMVEEMQNIVNKNLPGKNDVKSFGEQLIVNKNGKVVGNNPRLLIGATNLSVEEIVFEVHRIGGLAIASHIDKEMFSITSQLGFIPEDIDFDALELSPHYIFNYPALLQEHKSSNTPLVSFSDAHFLEDIGKVYTWFLMEEASIEEMKKALQYVDERKVRL
jgi:predicted metal-dependent phosphoesterase TrpH